MSAAAAAAAAAAAGSSPASDSAADAVETYTGRKPRSFDSPVGGGGHAHGNPAAIAAAAASAAAAAAGGTGTGSASQTRRKLLRQSLAQIYKHVARQLHTADASGHRLWHDDSAVAQLVSYVRETKTVLADSAAHSDYENQPLRIHFSGLVETLYSSIAAAKHEARSTAASFTHETRSGLYQLLERWCGLGRHADAARDGQLRMASAVVDHIKTPSDRAQAAAALDEDWYLLNIAAMRAMAVLCRAAPGRPDTAALADPGGPREKLTLFSWVSDALNHPDPRVQRIGQRAVQWTVCAAPEDAPMVRALVQLAYGVSVVSSVNNGFAAGAPPPANARQTSGLGLVLGAPPAASASAAAPLTLSTDRIALGYLNALSAVLAHGDSGRALAVAYVVPILPLVMFQLQSERHRIRRQALLILRMLCTHMSVGECLAMVDRVGPSIVSDIPAIASAAAARLTEAVADAFSAYSSGVVLETVRQIHAQSTYGSRFAALQALVRPWLANVRLELDSAPVAPAITPLGFSLRPAALARDSLLVLRCLLYVTVKADAGSMADMQGLWLALVDHDGSRRLGDPVHSNIWVVMRYLTGLLLRYWSPTLRGFVRRIAVFLTRSPHHGPELIGSLVRESMQPAAAMPLGEDDNDMCVGETLEQNANGEALLLSSEEPWTSEIPFLTARAADASSRPLASTGALAMFYLGAISYECSDRLVQHESLAVLLLPPALFMLAHPEQWCRDAARTVLVNLVAAERIDCIALSYGGARHNAGGGGAGSRLMPLADLSYIANDAAHVALGVLRSDECAAGFGNVDHALLRQASVSLLGNIDDARALNESNDFLFNGWSPTLPQPRESSSGRTPSSSRDANRTHRYHGYAQDDGEAGEHRIHEASAGSSPAGSKRLSTSSSSHNNNISEGIDVTDPSLVADVADIPAAALSQTTSPVAAASAAVDNAHIDSSLLEKSRNTVNGSLHSPHIRVSGGAKASHTDIDQSSSTASSPAMGGEGEGGGAGPKRRSSAASRRSIGSEHADGGHRERATLQRFMSNLSRLFGVRHPRCAQQWADVSVQWAMGCPVRPLAALALQSFSALVAEARFGGSLVITPTRQMVLHLADRLSNVVGDPAVELVSFTETVLSALKQTAALAARMCAENQAVMADLLAASLVLMRTAQSTAVYAMALSIFERIFPLAHGPEYDYLVATRIGPAFGPHKECCQRALLRGLEFALCRDRCLRMLRLAFAYANSASSLDDGARRSPLLPMLAIVAHVPSLLVDALHGAVSLQQQRICIDKAACRRNSLDSRLPENHPPASADNDGSGGIIAAGIGRGIRKQNSTKRSQPRAPSFSANALGSSLGLMFGGMRSSDTNQQQLLGEGGDKPTHASINTDVDNNSSIISLAVSQPPPPPQLLLQGPKESPSRLQLFRRRQSPRTKDYDSLSGSKESLQIWLEKMKTEKEELMIIRKIFCP
ncbi:Cell morphogenesis protein PAG1 [Coemansia sp. RSA 2559]|nr:Cell morphogenesis protein PAG1 [Coemansia sp. RSA 2559]